MEVTSRQRVRTALAHQQPDRAPCDLLAVPEIWHKLQDALGVGDREGVMRELQVDCRRISYDSYAAPPERFIGHGRVDWYDSPARSSAERVWRLHTSDGLMIDVWGARRRETVNSFGRYEDLTDPPLADADTLGALQLHDWFSPDWFDFATLPDDLAHLDAHGEYHLRYRIGSIFETAWSLRGFEQTLTDLALSPQVPGYIMDRIVEVLIETLRTVMRLAGERIDMLYYYDDLASMDSLLMSRAMWKRTVQPRQEKLLEVARSYGKPIMYHCDGALFPLLPELLDMGITVLNPIQTDAREMEPERLKGTFGDRLSFHGGVNITRLLPSGSPNEVREAVGKLVEVLGKDGGYILAPSHHIQGDTPIENVLAMYETELRA